MTCMIFLCIIALRNKTVAHTSLSSFDSKWPSLSRNLATMVTWCHKSPPNSFLCVLHTIHTWSVYQPFTTIEHLTSLKVFTVLFFKFCSYDRLISNSIECFHSRGQHLCKFIGTKGGVCKRKELNSHRICLGHQHGRRFIVLGHQYGGRDVMWKHSIEVVRFVFLSKHIFYIIHMHVFYVLALPWQMILFGYLIFL